jgi:hypothetical protein
MAKLVAHVIDGQILGVDILSWSLIKTPFKIINDNDTIPLGYTDISSVQTWWDYGQNLTRDYLYVRSEIRKLVAKKGRESNLIVSTLNTPPNDPANNAMYLIGSNPTGIWESHAGFISTYINNEWHTEPEENIGYRLLNNTEKLICAELKIGGQKDHFLDYGVPVIVDYGVEFHRKSIEVRKERMLRSTVEIYNRLPMNSTQVLIDLTTGPLGDTIGRYERYGVKGTYEDYHVDFNSNPTPGICDYIMARTPFDGTKDYTNAGFSTGLKLKNWNPIDASDISTFADEIYSILTEGYIEH